MQNPNSAAQKSWSHNFRRRTFVSSSIRLAVTIIFVSSFVGAQPRALAADPSEPVLKLLLKKNIISQQELNKARTDAEAIRTNNASLPATESKWKINNAIKNVELFGDLRLRYENRQVHDPGDGRIELNRERIAVRLGLRGEVLDDFYYGLRLDTANNPRSPWVSLGTSSSGAPYQGPFGKSTFNINVGQLYLGWKPASWLDISAGKIPNPFYFTPMTWDTHSQPGDIDKWLKSTFD